MKAFKDYLEETHEEGVIEEIIHSIVYVSGLPGATISEMVVFESGSIGQVMAVKRSHLEVIMLSRSLLQVGTKVARTGFPMQIKVSQQLIGRVLNPLGEVLEGNPVFQQDSDEMRPVDYVPLGIDRRKKISRSLETGIILVDLMIPLGMGQRELTMGDRKTGKSYLSRQSIVNQVNLGNICIYAAIGKRRSDIKRTLEYFKKMKIADKIIVVASGSHDSVGEIYLTPYSAMAIAEYFRDQGRDTLVILDDMTTHAKFYRELSLLARKFPGRDSYPGDIFHIHSKLLERAGNFKMDNGREASITCLPIADMVGDDMTGYIQTNLMSMTDGHIFFDRALYDAGRRPSINPFLSVTRVGHQTQSSLRRDINQKLYDLLNNYEKTQSFLRFGAELGENTRQVMTMGERLLKFFDQPDYLRVPLNVQIVLLAILWTGIWDGRNIEKVVEAYIKDPQVKTNYDKVVSESKDFNQLVDLVRRDGESYMRLLK
jgi:F-type H+/Na+-transporting ATPase subunit alpha